MVRLIALLLLLAGLLIPAQSKAQDGRWDTLEATMVILKDDAPPPAAANQIVLPPQLEARLRQRVEQRKSDPVVSPVPVSMGGNSMGSQAVRELQQEFHQRMRQQGR
ncbi:MAG: hypothetical protein COZ12_09770 [Deltaproteobacteria bacterium CG_4_10_14_3_um_filter_60_8]|nr:MAG: hypothetical protein AUK28_00125 [Desulfobacterales bacterium CG2_30_60_27]PIP43754.1 MAG: hypothetical protein COX17_05265 [Deltaproteobacteria bacterium CG23_combo_of_CG06-09_8_20_14_all_60_8]PIY20214.1 MAG: hypothetical protein COZ12_09770 [Deltaproteobacteria bacterium CG_4_10_14_3_um_filter_60_8]